MHAYTHSATFTCWLHCGLHATAVGPPNMFLAAVAGPPIMFFAAGCHHGALQEIWGVMQITCILPLVPPDCRAAAFFPAAAKSCVHTLSLARSPRGRASGDSTLAASASLSSSRLSHSTISNALLTCGCVCMAYYAKQSKKRIKVSAA